MCVRCTAEPKHGIFVTLSLLPVHLKHDPRRPKAPYNGEVVYSLFEM